MPGTVNEPFLDLASGHVLYWIPASCHECGALALWPDPDPSLSLHDIIIPKPSFAAQTHPLL
jgi:hypothetical protein